MVEIEQSQYCSRFNTSAFISGRRNVRINELKSLNLTRLKKIRQSDGQNIIIAT